MNKQKENAVVEVSSLTARTSMTADQRAKIPFYAIITGMTGSSSSKAYMASFLNVLPCGSGKPLLTDDITQLTGINRSTIKKIVRHMRIAGIPIASCKRGYYLCTSDAEKARFSIYLAKKIATAAKELECFQSYSEVHK